MIIQPKMTKKDILKRIQDSTESNVFIYEPIITSSLQELLTVLKKLFSFNTYLTIIVIKNK
jgi:hypothetical protein